MKNKSNCIIAVIFVAFIAALLPSPVNGQGASGTATYITHDQWSSLGGLGNFTGFAADVNGDSSIGIMGIGAPNNFNLGPNPTTWDPFWNQTLNYSITRDETAKYTFTISSGVVPIASGTYSATSTFNALVVMAATHPLFGFVSLTNITINGISVPNSDIVTDSSTSFQAVTIPISSDNFTSFTAQYEPGSYNFLGTNPTTTATILVVSGANIEVVPEPSTVMLMVGGLALIASLKRKNGK